MRIAVLYSEIPFDAPPEEQDAFVQARTVVTALEALGHRPEAFGVSLDLAELRERFRLEPPELAFNLVEGLGGSDRLIHLVPAALEAWRIRYTGSPADALRATTSKRATKRVLQEARLATPRAVWPREANDAAVSANVSENVAYIIKPVWEHASFGMDDDSVVRAANLAELVGMIERRSEQLGCDCFAEEFVFGREFNVSLLAGPVGAEVLPLAEIDFSTFPADKPQIVGYRAKWDVAAFEYQNTPRFFAATPTDEALQACIRQAALDCWRVFDLDGYARVDFRIGSDLVPMIVDVNANPCLAPDAGFIAATEQAGLSAPAVIDRILAAAMAK